MNFTLMLSIYYNTKWKLKQNVVCFCLWIMRMSKEIVKCKCFCFMMVNYTMMSQVLFKAQASPNIPFNQKYKLNCIRNGVCHDHICLLRREFIIAHCLHWQNYSWWLLRGLMVLDLNFIFHMWLFKGLVVLDLNFIFHMCLLNDID